MKKIIVVASALLTTVLLADPVDKAMNDKIPGSDGSSGCGLGWHVIPKKTLLGSTVRSTTNASASNTIAMTMGTSGCDKHDLVLKEKEIEHFANVNYENIASEMARGNGEYLSSLASHLGCNEKSFSQFSQNYYSQIIGNSGEQLISNIKEKIISNPSSCL